MVILYFIAVILLVILARTFMFTPKAQAEPEIEELSFCKDKAVEALAELIKCRTISYYDKSMEDDAEFEKLIGLLPKLYPNVMAKCQFSQLPDRALLFRWKGKNDGQPAVLMAHYDVVPVNEKEWDKPAFEAIIENGEMWGRGTLDTKGTFNGILFAANELIAQGFTPENDIYFAFSGGEEVGGMGAVNIVNYFKEQGITPSFVLDEGGAVVENVFPGVKKPCAVIGIAEKGMMNLEFSVKSAGGHASAPAPHTPVGKLSAACVKLENKPFKAHFTKPVLEMFDTLGRHSTFLYRMIFANLWCFKGVLDLICKKSGGELNALVRTTVAFTQMEGSKAPNVIPPEAKMVANLRLNPMDTVDSALSYIKNVIKDDDIQLNATLAENPSRLSSTDCEGWDKVCNAVSATWPGCIPTPYLMVACSDSRRYGVISDRVYRFCAMDLTKEERGMIHGNNERIRIELIERAVEFFIRIMKQC